MDGRGSGVHFILTGVSAPSSLGVLSCRTRMRADAKLAFGPYVNLAAILNSPRLACKQIQVNAAISFFFWIKITNYDS